MTPNFSSAFSPRSSRGFTLIGLVMVLIIMGIITAAVLPVASALRESSVISTEREQCQKLAAALRKGWSLPSKCNTSVFINQGRQWAGGSTIALTAWDNPKEGSDGTTFPIYTLFPARDEPCTGAPGSATTAGVWPYAFTFTPTNGSGQYAGSYTPGTAAAPVAVTWQDKVALAMGVHPGTTPTTVTPEDWETTLGSIVWNSKGRRRTLLVGPDDEPDKQRYLLISEMISSNEGDDDRSSELQMPLPAAWTINAWTAVFNDLWSLDTESADSSLPPPSASTTPGTVWANYVGVNGVNEWNRSSSGRTNLSRVVITKIIQPKYSLKMVNGHIKADVLISVGRPYSSGNWQDDNQCWYFISQSMNGKEIWDHGAATTFNNPTTTTGWFTASPVDRYEVTAYNEKYPYYFSGSKPGTAGSGKTGGGSSFYCGSHGAISRTGVFAASAANAYGLIPGDRLTKETPQNYDIDNQQRVLEGRQIFIYMDREGMDIDGVGVGFADQLHVQFPIKGDLMYVVQ